MSAPKTEFELNTYIASIALGMQSLKDSKIDFFHAQSLLVNRFKYTMNAAGAILERQEALTGITLDR